MTHELTERLADIDDPALGDDGEAQSSPDRTSGQRPQTDIVSLGLVGDVEVKDGTAHVPLAFGAPHSPTETRIADQVRDRVREAGYEPSLSVEIDDDTPAGRIDDAPNVVAVSSGKGGVGKSTIAVNLATAMAERGARVGLFDADVYGPNIPRMLGVHDRPGMAEDDETIIPVEKHGLKLMSIGFLVGDDDPVIWRGAMVDKVLTQLYDDTEWGELDYFVVDLPPGTGDAQLTMLQQMPVLGSIVVTTPQDVALDNARKGARMFNKHDAEVLGFVENMSTFVCPGCGDAHNIFDTGGGERLAEEFDHPLLAEIPLDPSVRESGEVGDPIVTRTGSDTASTFKTLGDDVMDAVGRLRRESHAESASSPADPRPPRT